MRQVVNKGDNRRTTVATSQQRQHQQCDRVCLKENQQQVRSVCAVNKRTAMVETGGVGWRYLTKTTNWACFGGDGLENEKRRKGKKHGRAQSLVPSCARLWIIIVSDAPAIVHCGQPPERSFAHPTTNASASRSTSHRSFACCCCVNLSPGADPNQLRCPGWQTPLHTKPLEQPVRKPVGRVVPSTGSPTGCASSPNVHGVACF